MALPTVTDLSVQFADILTVTKCPSTCSSINEFKPKCFIISMVYAAADIYHVTPESLPSIWRGSQLDSIKGRRHISDGWFD